MKYIILILILLLELNAKTKTINVKQVRYLIHLKHYTGDLWGQAYYCRYLNKIEYCIRDDKNFIYKSIRHNRDSAYAEIYDYKTGNILMEGYTESNLNNGNEATGIWKIYDYKHHKIKYIDFNKKPRISRKAVNKWVIKQGIKLKDVLISNAIYKAKRAWQVDVLSMDVYIDAKSGKFLGFKLPDTVEMVKPIVTKKRYKCVNRELSKGTKIYKMFKKCNLMAVARTGY